MSAAARRLYPLRPAAAVPGRTVHARVQLRAPTPEPEPENVSPQASLPALFPDWRYAHSYGYSPSGYRDEFFTVKHASGLEIPAAHWEGGLMTRCWVNIGPVKNTLRFRAVLLGDVIIRPAWRVELDVPDTEPYAPAIGDTIFPHGFIDVHDLGTNLDIRVHAPDTRGSDWTRYQRSGAPWAAHLTMTATAGGKECGALEMWVGFKLKQHALQRQERAYDMVLTAGEHWPYGSGHYGADPVHDLGTNEPLLPFDEDNWEG